MRLLNSTTLQLHEFFGATIPPYAILSHTWEDDEVSFQDMHDEVGIQKAGYHKITNCCKTAAADGFEYAWVDTCCINKTSRSELSEAINSMYRWYQYAEVCYVFLSDVPSPANPRSLHSAFRKSRWFTRGWTLQELIAPSQLAFFGSDWNEVGTKLSLKDLVSEITGIPEDVLLGASLESFSVSQRMSWASKRQTTRSEDLAYCLMGLFGVNMPMLYGEGEGAFGRLQQEIMNISDDQTIFIWKSDSWWEHRGGLLADSPAAFVDSGNIVQCSNRQPDSFSWTNGGIRLCLPLKPLAIANSYLAIVDCQELGENEILLGLVLEYIPSTDGHFQRATSDEIQKIDSVEGLQISRQNIFIKQHQRQKKPASHGFYHLLSVNERALQEQGIKFVGAYPFDHHEILKGGNIFIATFYDNILCALRFEHRSGDIFDVTFRMKDKILSAFVDQPEVGESLREMYWSFRKEYSVVRLKNPPPFSERQRIWGPDSDRVIWRDICVAVKRQLVSGVKRLTICINQV